MAESGSCGRYEFDAPSHVIDFVSLENDEGEDVWFEQQAGAADGHLRTPMPEALRPPRVMTGEDSGPSTSTLPPPALQDETLGSPARTGARPKRSAAVQPPAKARRKGDKLEKVRTFRARPLPKSILEGVVGVPEKKVRNPTVPESPAFAPKRIRLEKVEEGKGEEALFKARPNTIAHKEPFRPKKEARTPLVVEPFALLTERRALERQEFDQRVTEKEALRMKMEEEQRREWEWEEKEKEEITRMRQEQVHTAQPIRRYKPVTVKKSEVQLTVPHSPNFSDRL